MKAVEIQNEIILAGLDLENLTILKDSVEVYVSEQDSCICDRDATTILADKIQKILGFQELSFTGCGSILVNRRPSSSIWEGQLI